NWPGRPSWSSFPGPGRRSWLHAVSLGLGYPMRLMAMRKYVFVLVVTLFQGCLIYSRTWDLGLCRELPTSSCVCEVKVPRSRVGVELTAEIRPKLGESIAVNTPLTLRIENKESNTIQIQGLRQGDVYLKPGESFEVM